VSDADAASTRALSRLVGVDLSAYRERHVSGRIERAVVREEAGDLTGLVRLLRGNAEARRRFRRSVAVSVSGLLRDREQFDLLERELLPPLVATGRRLRVWSAGCADGAELYSVAFVLDRVGALDRTLLLGSDLLDENLEAARRGVYGDVTVPNGLRARVRWERRDLVREGPPSGRWDVVLCRNVAIYLTREARDALHATLAAALAPGGVLLVGRSEWVPRAAALGLERAGPHAYRTAR
jgi:chemotaxis protein methyltransferase CheR